MKQYTIDKIINNIINKRKQCAAVQLFTVRHWWNHS